MTGGSGSIAELSPAVTLIQHVSLVEMGATYASRTLRYSPMVLEGPLGVATHAGWAVLRVGRCVTGWFFPNPQTRQHAVGHRQARTGSSPPRRPIVRELEKLRGPPCGSPSWAFPGCPYKFNSDRLSIQEPTAKRALVCSPMFPWRELNPYKIHDVWYNCVVTFTTQSQRSESHDRRKGAERPHTRRRP